MRNYTIHFTSHSLIRMILLTGIIGLFIWGSIVAAKSFSTDAEAAGNYQLSYRSVSVNTNDTLWSIAKENYSEEWGTFSEYLEEIMRCNALRSEEITAGSSLVVPVYLPVYPL